MTTGKHRVAIVLCDLDEDRLLELLMKGDVWITDTAPIRQAFQRILTSHDAFSFPGNLTRFSVRRTAVVDQLADVFETLFDHYNEYTFSGDWEELLVVSAASAEEVLRALGGEFDARAVQTSYGVVVTKISEM